MQATRQLEVIAGFNPSRQTPVAAKGDLFTLPLKSTAMVSAAAADTAEPLSPRHGSCRETAGRLNQQQQHSISSQQAGLRRPQTAISHGAGNTYVTAVEEHESQLVPAEPDTAVLEFAVALAHHHDAITGTSIWGP